MNNQDGIIDIGNSINNAPTKDQIEAKLRELNPIARECDKFSSKFPFRKNDRNYFKLPLTTEVIQDVLRGLPKGSANGFSGWTYNIIQRLYKEDVFKSK